jgi:hypothetical protein
MIVKCKNEALREDGTKIMNFTKGKEYKVVNEYEECFLIEDDNGEEEKFFDLKTMFETLK